MGFFDKEGRKMYRDGIYNERDLMHFVESISI